MVGLLRKQGLSYRQVCRLAGISRSADTYSASEHNQPLLERMKALAFEYIHYGYRRIWALLQHGLPSPKILAEVEKRLGGPLGKEAGA